MLLLLVPRIIVPFNENLVLIIHFDKLFYVVENHFLLFSLCARSTPRIKLLQLEHSFGFNLLFDHLLPRLLLCFSTDTLRLVATAFALAHLTAAHVYVLLRYYVSQKCERTFAENCTVAATLLEVATFHVWLHLWTDLLGVASLPTIHCWLSVLLHRASFKSIRRLHFVLLSITVFEDFSRLVLHEVIKKAMFLDNFSVCVV